MKELRAKVTVVVGGMAGSEGKGKVAGYLAIHDDMTHAICNFMPNAGHTWRSGDKKVMVQTLPQAVVNPHTTLMISAGSAIEPELLENELKKYGGADRLIIHPRAMVVTQEHRDKEKKSMVGISSTCKGCGEATVEKIRRGNANCLAKDYEQFGDYTVTQDDWNFIIRNELRSRHTRMLVEAPQGFDLDINHGIQYPYCTSRQTTAAQAIADAGIPCQAVTDVIAVIRPYPIRVGNVYDEETGEMIGYSGDYAHSQELTWDEVGRRAGAPKGSFDGERTTVTNKIRRVFEPDFRRLRNMCYINGVTGIALMFADYIDWSIKGKNRPEDITPKIQEFIDKVEEITDTPVVLVGTGADDKDMIDLRKIK